MDTLHGTEPIPLLAVPTTVPRPTQPDATAIEAIRNTLALYPFSIDGKNWTALSNVFTPDAVFNFSGAIGLVTGLAAIQAMIAEKLKPVTTQHRLGTQYIQVGASGGCEENADKAFSATYFVAEHFGMGVHVGQVATAYAQYQDSWARQDDGGWRIVYRNLVYMGPLIGNLSVFAPQ